MKYEFFIKHSLQVVKKFALRTSFCGMLLLALLYPQAADAQMFSVDDDPVDQAMPGTAVFLGWEPAQFDYRGPVGGGAYEFTGPLLRLRLESPGLNLFLGVGGRLTGLEDISYFDAGVKVNYGLTVYRKERFVIQLPVQLSTSITSVVNRNIVGITTQFQQGSFTGGLGLGLFLRPWDRIRFQANFVPSYGFSFATGNTFGGSLAMAEGQARMYIDRVFGELGLSFGYDYTFRRYNIEEDIFDYDLTAHSILVGLTF